MINYKTIINPSEVEIIEKKSRFIATVIPVATQEEAEQALQQLRKKYYNATHNCFAYQIGEKNQIQRCSDDGEPQGTAGKPILDILKGYGTQNTLICVTRYFGGTLLGTGGLVRAYSRAAKEGILAAGIKEKRVIQLYILNMSYSLLGKVQHLLAEKGYVLRNTTYLETVTCEVEVEVGHQEAFCKWLTENTNAEVLITEGELTYIDVPLDVYC
ncbi:YigZ family protein [Sporanaerobium hydrogeniformans]|uniref:YigZ family protein n=1 Tax=Sporanaerobium hydrogeniformans TaxID=3072179 RepID=A0AC61DBS1_9FIRM|nr:YigZ family protein [Sporanaerobium hydrogeniformans]PHV70680.1 YigZ family protein [Sporanaerobium hydrogeniformans]